MVSDTTLSGSELADAIDQANTATGGTGTVFTITDASEITGSEANFTDLLTDEGNSQIAITGQNLTVNTGEVSVSTARSLSDTTTGTVTGTITSGTTIAAMLDENTGLTGTDAYTITIAAGDAEATATDLTALYGKTSVAVDASAVTQITGTVAEANIVYGAGSSEITGLGNEIVVTTESSLILESTGSAGSSTLAGLNTLDNNTVGMVNAGSITSITGSLADLLTAYGSNGITGLGNEAITVSDTTSLAASDLNSLDSKTSGTVTTSTSLETLTGTVAALNTAYGSSGLSIEGDEAITISDTTVDAKALNVLNNYTSGVINAGTLTKLTGALVDVNVAFAADAPPAERQ